MSAFTMLPKPKRAHEKAKLACVTPCVLAARRGESDGQMEYTYTLFKYHGDITEHVEACLQDQIKHRRLSIKKWSPMS